MLIQQAAREARIRLLTGIKRYVHAKRAEGLLSPEGLLRLDEACDHALDNPDRSAFPPFSPLPQPLSARHHVDLCHVIEFWSADRAATLQNFIVDLELFPRNLAAAC